MKVKWICYFYNAGRQEGVWNWQALIFAADGQPVRAEDIKKGVKF